MTNYHRILKPGVPRLRGQFLRVTLVPWEVLVPPTGPFRGCFEFSPSNAMFLSLSLEICKLPSYFSNRESRGWGVSSYELHWSRGRCWCHPRGRSGAVSSSHPLTPCVLPNSTNIQIIIVFSNRESRGCGVSSTSYIGPMGGVGATHGAVRGMFRVLTH